MCQFPANLHLLDYEFSIHGNSTRITRINYLMVCYTSARSEMFPALNNEYPVLQKDCLQVCTKKS